jgi:hypothetical protein
MILIEERQLNNFDKYLVLSCKQLGSIDGSYKIKLYLYKQSFLFGYVNSSVNSKHKLANLCLLLPNFLKRDVLFHKLFLHGKVQTYNFY